MPFGSSNGSCGDREERISRSAERGADSNGRNVQMGRQELCQHFYDLALLANSSCAVTIRV